MEEQKNLRIIFTEKAEAVFSDILRNNNLQEGDEDFLDELENDKESKENIMRDAVKIIAKKMIPDAKVSELLQKHLEISQEASSKLVSDIKSNLLPLLLIYPDEKFNDSAFREEISKKLLEPTGSVSEVKSETKELIERIKANRPAPALQNTPHPIPEINLKKVAIADVDKNAENMKKEGQNITTEEKNKLPEKPISGPQDSNTKSDTYREPIE